MRREVFREAVRALAALAGPAARERARAALRTLAGPAGRERARSAWAAARRRPEVVLAIGLVAGVVVMIVHWS